MTFTITMSDTYKEKLKKRGIKYSDVHLITIKLGLHISEDAVYKYINKNFEIGKYAENLENMSQLQKIIDEIIQNHDTFIASLKVKLFPDA